MAINSGWRITRAGVALVLGIILLVGIVWGVLFVAKERGDQARRDEAIALAEQQLTDESNGEIAIEVEEAATEQPKPEQESSTAGGGASELPQTGPADTFVALFAIVALTVASASYVQSRKLHLE